MNIYVVSMIIWGISIMVSGYVSVMVIQELQEKIRWVGIFLFITFFGMTLFSVISFFTNCVTVMGNDYGLNLHYIAKIRSLISGIVIICINYVYILIKNNKL